MNFQYKMSRARVFYLFNSITLQGQLFSSCLRSDIPTFWHSYLFLSSSSSPLIHNLRVGIAFGIPASVLTSNLVPTLVYNNPKLQRNIMPDTSASLRCLWLWICNILYSGLHSFLLYFLRQSKVLVFENRIIWNMSFHHCLKKFLMEL